MCERKVEEVFRGCLDGRVGIFLFEAALQVRARRLSFGVWCGLSGGQGVRRAPVLCAKGAGGRRCCGNGDDFFARDYDART